MFSIDSDFAMKPDRPDIQHLQKLIVERGRKSLAPLRATEAKALCVYALWLEEENARLLAEVKAGRIGPSEHGE